MHNIARAIQDLDKVALVLPQVLAASKSITLASNARAIGELSEALHLEILLERPRDEVVTTSFALLSLVKHTMVLTSSSRAGQHARMTVALAQRLAEDVHKLLKQWASQQMEVAV